MKILNEVKKAAIKTLVTVLGHDMDFARIRAEIERANKDMPDATGADKRHRVMNNLKVIFDEVVEPVAESVLRLLLELGVAYIKAQAKL